MSESPEIVILNPEDNSFILPKDSCALIIHSNGVREVLAPKPPEHDDDMMPQSCSYLIWILQLIQDALDEQSRQPETPVNQLH